ncbi:dienelactone hydrolase family protein [Ancylothrix sp. C2]|uniref:dienelactone hydrolase family protein n=1 Tax=Ancylothrix sp. D3o TaxID=2953691 RepID=UPI0021BB12B6|nr:dienelactone hydrolase family protein [Ancylothrix sp. D3o]MCT7951974.1 dienelactone hydrolase family protein [Ancylothrix sp. D3o]
MTDLNFQTEWVSVANNDLHIAAYLAYPQGEGPFPAVVVLQEIFGVNTHIQEVSERFAKQGYVAIAPALYQRLAPDYQTGYTPEDIKQGRYYKELTHADELLSDISASISYLKTRRFVKTHGFGCIGFCFGGHVAYLAATLPEIKATASFYGAGITTWTPGGGQPTINRTAEITGTVYAFFGDQDASIPQTQVNQIEAELQKHHIPHRVFRYANADHGFFCDHRPSYNSTAAADAWLQVVEFFGQVLN